MGAGASSTSSAVLSAKMPAKSPAKSTAANEVVDVKNLEALRERLNSKVGPAELAKCLKRGVSVLSLKRLARRNANLNVKEFIDQVVHPNTVKTGKRFCNKIGKGQAEAFISVAWATRISDLAAAVSSVLPDDTYVLLDATANFHVPDGDVESVRSLDEMRKKREQDYRNFTQVIRSVDKLVSVTVTTAGTAESTFAWKRTWCVWELGLALVHGIKVAILVGCANADGVFVPNVEVAKQASGTVRVRDSKCLEVEEKLALVEDIEHFRGGVEAVEEFIDKALRRACADMPNQLNDIYLWLHALERDLGQRHKKRYLRYAPQFIENFASLKDVSDLQAKEVSDALDACNVRAFGDRKHLTRAIAKLASDPRFGTVASSSVQDVDADVEQNEGTTSAINAPGRWDFFISYTQRNDRAQIVARTLYEKLRGEGKEVWFDIEMRDKSEAAMQEGILKSSCVIAVISDVYLERAFCLKELTWARRSGKCIQPVVDGRDKGRIGELVAQGPPEMQFLLSIDFVDLIMSDKEYMAVGVSKVLKNLDDTTTRSQTPTPFRE